MIDDTLSPDGLAAQLAKSGGYYYPEPDEYAIDQAQILQRLEAKYREHMRLLRMLVHDWNDSTPGNNRKTVARLADRLEIELRKL